MTKGPSGYTGYATVSKTMLKECVNSRGMLSEEQANLLGVAWPLPKNWREIVLGKKISWAARHAAPKMKREPRGETIASMSTSDRDRFVLSLGHNSFGGYISSKKFSAIRRNALAELGRECSYCGQFASLVKHIYYSRENLSGKSTDGMVPICRDCLEKTKRQDASING